MKIYPTGDRIVVLPLLPQDKTKGGIVIPEMAKDRPLKGIVLAVGTGTLLESGARVPLEVEEGDVVYFGKYAGIHVPDEDLALDVVLMRQEEVLGRNLRADLPTELDGDPRRADVQAAAEAESRATLEAIRGELVAGNRP